MSAYERIASWFNETREEEEEEKQQAPRQVNNNRENSMGTGIAIGAAAAAGVFAAWGISKLLSDNTDTQERIRDHHSREPQVRNPLNMVLESSNQRSIWSPPSPGRYKMNTDASCRPKQVGNGDLERGPSGYGGILRDHHGEWVRGFIGYIDEADVLTSEIHGVHEGLKLLDKLKFKGAILETDNKGAHDWVNYEFDYRRQTKIIRTLWPIIQECKVLAKKNNITIKHINGKDANQCADMLADKARKEKQYYLEIEDLPPELEDLVEEDRSNFN